MAYIFIIGGGVLLFAGGLFSFFYYLRWRVTLYGQTISLTNVFGRTQSYQLSEITEFLVKPDRYRHMPDLMRRELGNQDPKTIVDAIQGNKRLFAFSSADSGFIEICERLGLELPDYDLI